VKCWNCQADTHGQVFCPVCGKIVPPAPQTNHFELFGLPRSVDVDPNVLDQRFRELSLRLHPDRQAGVEARERRLSLERTTALNEAYRVLKDKVRRAFYLLKLHGVDLDREDFGTQKDMPLEFLEEVMELREALEEARARRDLESARRMAEDVRERERKALEEATGALRLLERTNGAPEAVRAAAHALARVRYFTRFLQEHELMEEEALGG
jgi:molecular chaperone HscB